MHFYLCKDTIFVLLYKVTTTICVFGISFLIVFFRKKHNKTAKNTIFLDLGEEFPFLN